MRKPSTAPTMAATALRPRKSETLRSPGLPAWASFRSVRLACLGLVMRWTLPERRIASGRTVRSKKGCWSSSSSRFLACMEPSCVSRAWTGSTAGRRPGR